MKIIMPPYLPRTFVPVYVVPTINVNIRFHPITTIVYSSVFAYNMVCKQNVRAVWIVDNPETLVQFVVEYKTPEGIKYYGFRIWMFTFVELRAKLMGEDNIINWLEWGF